MKKNIDTFTSQFYHRNTAVYLIALSQTFMEAGCSLGVSWLLQQLIDLIGGSNTGFTLVQLALITLGLIVTTTASTLVMYHTKPRFISRALSQYKEYVFGELTKKNIAAFSAESTSPYISGLTNDMQVIEKGYLQNTFTMFSSLITFIGAMILMFWYSPILTLIAVALSILPLAASLVTGSKVACEETKVSQCNEAYTATLRDSLSGFPVIKSFKAEQQMIRLFRDNVERLANAQCKRDKMKVLVALFGTVAGVVAQLGVFLFGAWLAISGKGMTAGTTLIFVQLMNYVLSPIGTIPTCLAERNAAKALIAKIAKALSANLREEADYTQISLKRGITVDGLTFGYEPKKTILHDISYTFKLGRKYAIVGASGSGKSTLLNLLMAAHPQYEGTICYDDTELRHINTGSLYEMQGIIQQNVFIFNASIRDNITMFRAFPEEEIDEAIRLSGLSALIADKSTDYLCGENGSGLSGGEKQRISIARSLLKKTQVLLVDEATAALDAETAHQVSSSILDLDGITGIVVTHSLEESLLSRYDSILTLKNGYIAEAGTFDELIARKGYFYSLFTVSQ
ncbi:MAG: ABC transporter ATP-binding protein [Clostridiales bacterium]|nr:ABC transporter ATP-binding protein [Clostridiales bacterium]